MRTRLWLVEKAARVGCTAASIILVVAACGVSAQEATSAGTSPPETAASPVTSVPGANPSDAEDAFRNGVALYNRGLFLEALSEFNRALALDPQMENAKIYRDKTNAKLAVSATGVDAGATATFETVDLESIPGPGEAPQLSAEEMKIKRVAELLEQGEKYLEYQRYRRAVELFEEVLLIAPDNERAKEGLHKATIGASQEDITRSEKNVQEDRARIRKYIEDSKQLPEGAGPTGIKEYRISIPVVEEEYVPPKETSKIEKILDSPVSIEFENIHLNDILTFISDTYDVNIVPDDRVIMKPQKPAPATPGAPGAPGVPGAPGAYPAPYPTAAPVPGVPRPPTAGIGRERERRDRSAFGGLTQTAVQPLGGQAGSLLTGEYVTDGMVPYIALKNVKLRDALNALLRPLNLSYSVQPGFIWISTPEKIRLESFEPLETRYYELRNAGAETLFKIVLLNPGGGGGYGGGGYGGYGGGGYGGGGYGGGGYGGGGYGGGGYGGGGYGGYGGGGYCGGRGGYGGGGYGGGGYGGGGYGGGGYGGGGYGGGGYGGGRGGYGGGGYGGGGYGGGGYGGYGGGGYGGGGYGGGGYGGGGYGGGGYGGYGGGGGIQIQNVAELFSTISDLMVGETPAIIGTAGLSTGGTGTVGTARAGGTQYGAGGIQGATGAAQLGTAGRSSNVYGDEPEIVRLLRLLIDDVYEPNGIEPISRMIYVPHNNQLIVVNTPTNLEKLEKQLAELDITPKQVSIEAKFLTIKAEDLDKMGFKWNITQSDLNNRNRQIPEIAESQTYQYDINGDGELDEIPFYQRPNGTNVITNTVTSAVLEAAASPGPAGAFSLSGIITDNEDGDKVSVIFDYLNTLEESELLSAPRVTTMNRKPAVIVDLTTEYFVSYVHTEIVTTEGTLGSAGRLGYTQDIQPEPFNFGITLSVTPQISGGDQIRLWLNPQVTTRGLEKKFTQRSVIEGNEFADEITLPNTSTQAVWTNVIVADGDTLVLGGLVSDQTITGKHKMPYLADIPVLGFFFQGKSRQVKQSSLLIFVTPTIIDTTGARFFEEQASSSRRGKSVSAPATSEVPGTKVEEATPLVEPERIVEPVTEPPPKEKT